MAPTILEVLNPDCWRAVLSHLDVADLVRLERVSRGWRELVREYLPSIHHFKIEGNTDKEKCVLLRKCGNFDSFRRLTVRAKKTEMLQRIGPHVESLVWTNPDQTDFTAMEQYCSNLKHLTYICTTDYSLPLEKMTKCKQLKRVIFEGYAGLHDAHLAYLVMNESIEELVINGSGALNGLFLTKLRSNNLKSLMLYHCSEMELACLFSAVDYLTGLRRLDLCHLSKCSRHFSEICWLLERLPNLEHLALDGYNRTPFREEFVEAVGSLSLKHLSLIINENVDDEWIEQVVRACRELRCLNLQFCNGVSGRGLAALCRARPSLTALVATFIEASDAELADCIEACPELTLLDVSACSRVTPALVARAGAATKTRSHQLTMRVAHTAITKAQFGPDGPSFDRRQLAGLILDWGEK